MAKKSNARPRKCEKKTVCRAVGAKKPPSAKQKAWRAKFTRAAIECRAGNPQKYASCMKSALK